MDSSGNLYGTTEIGGADNDGTVFEVAKGSSTITTLATFSGSTGTEPAGGFLLLDSSGNLYGTTGVILNGSTGETGNDGTVFELAKGSRTITTLASFNGTNGAGPESALVMDSSGNLYGTTAEGGARQPPLVTAPFSSLAQEWQQHDHYPGVIQRRQRDWCTDWSTL